MITMVITGITGLKRRMKKINKNVKIIKKGMMHEMGLLVHLCGI